MVKDILHLSEKASVTEVYSERISCMIYGKGYTETWIFFNKMRDWHSCPLRSLWLYDKAWTPSNLIRITYKGYFPFTFSEITNIYITYDHRVLAALDQVIGVHENTCNQPIKYMRSYCNNMQHSSFLQICIILFINWENFL